MNKSFTIIIGIFILLLSCQKKEDKIKSNNKEIQHKNYSIKNFYDFDELIHYEYLNDDINLPEFGDEKKKKDKDQIEKENIIIGKKYKNGIPQSEKDTTFISQLEKLGFKKQLINKKFNNQINSIFSERKSELLYSSCFPFYRDILVFKRKNKTIGITKICFECGQSIFFGAKNETTYFGQGNEYSQLKSLLNKKLEEE